MTDILHYIGTDPVEKKQIEDEQEAYRILDLAVREKTNELKIELLESKRTIDDQARLIEELRRKLGEK